MKKTLLCLLLLVAGAMNAQIVNIPDANFKNFLLNYQPAIDTNGDGEIQVTEAQALTTMFTTETYPLLYANMQGLEAFTNLTTLSMIGNVSSLDLHELTALESLSINNENLSSLNISGLTNLNTLSLHGLWLNDLDLSEFQNLTVVNLNAFDNLESITVGVHFLLTEFRVSSITLTELDLSNCPNLAFISISLTNTVDDLYVNIKNGSTVTNNDDYGYSNITLGSGPYFSSNIYYICMDEGEEENSAMYISDSAVISTYCSFTPGGDYNTITGTVTLDAGNNGCDSSDTAIPFSSVQITNGDAIALTSSSDGTYRFDATEAGTYNVMLLFESEWFTSQTETVVFDTINNSTITQNFCVTASGVHNDVEVVIIPLNSAQPGFDAHYKIIYKNKGNQTLSGNLTFVYDDAVLDYVLATPAETTAAAGSLTFSYTNLLPFENRAIYVTVNVNSPMETPAVNIDDVLPFMVSITPTSGDETPADNTFALNQTVVGSFDPNDITCLEGATVNPDRIGDYLHYNINFENTGTAPATFVVVKDIIDAAKFDVSSLVVLNASHAVEARVTGNKVEFIFDNINLAANGGKGNVTFKIKSLETLAVNSSVMQKADIFFDYNWPIITNEAVTTYALLNAPGFTGDSTIKVYPNPANNIVHIAANSAIQSIELLDVQGRLLEARGADDVNATLDITQRANGIYFIKIATDKGVSIEKLIKQ